MRSGDLGRSDREPIEERSAILGALLEEAPQHREVERLAEAARPRQQHDLGVGIDDRIHERGLVDVAIAVLPQRAEVREPKGEAQARGGHGAFSTRSIARSHGAGSAPRVNRA